ncbi:GGDEF domain-containing protein [Qipengyuania sp. 1NDH17]|uniref:diguanylate cyclase n=1 Tax=Qipengyuania polymorpha TaxID=2867234 RepID=A0ABS7IYA4_9SPHN|nr:GGDEF domain-containing protein [Qipengyuania polymorpha]MBX7458540.1 GGDEF domain-containing protein [Qipengyuania polymorpha]
MTRARDDTHSDGAGMIDWWKGKRIACPVHLRAALETAVDDQHYREARFLAVLGMLVALISLTVDLVTIPEHFGLVAIVRLMVTAPVLLAVLAIPRSRLALQKFLLGAGLSVFSLTLLFASGFAPPPADSFMAVGVIMMLGIALPLLPFRRRGIVLFIAAVVIPSGILVIFQQKAEGYAETFLLILTLVATGAGVLARRFRWLDRRNALLTLQAKDRARELERSNARLTQLSMLDPLTDLANRRWAEQAFERDYAARREDAPGLTAVLLLDLDHFKNFNDRWGHEAGDKCLQAVAEVLRHCAGRHGGLAARFGGEEFVVCCASKIRQRHWNLPSRFASASNASILTTAGKPPPSAAPSASASWRTKKGERPYWAKCSGRPTKRSTKPRARAAIATGWRPEDQPASGRAVAPPKSCGLPVQILSRAKRNRPAGRHGERGGNCLSDDGSAEPAY